VTNRWTVTFSREQLDAMWAKIDIDAIIARVVSGEYDGASSVAVRIKELEAEVGRLTNELAQMTAQRDIAREHNARVVSELATRAKQVPYLDWSKAPDWAQWWTVDANGESYYYEVEPGLCATTWEVASTERFMSAGKVELGGRNWRMMVQVRPSDVGMRAAEMGIDAQY